MLFDVPSLILSIAYSKRGIKAAAGYFSALRNFSKSEPKFSFDVGLFVSLYLMHRADSAQVFYRRDVVLM
jgi:hypothetical protein